jgi:DNA-binding NarL/FixJ family response regulator
MPKGEPPKQQPGERPVGVLVVDDHPAMRGVLSDMITSLDGFALVADAATGEAALELAGRLQPDLALVDVQLPGISGIAVARRLTTVSPQSVVILMSASDELLRTEAAASCGAAASLPKRDLTARALRALWMGNRPDAR